jgi:DNA-binding beta-propeller fold protein YncE
MNKSGFVTVTLVSLLALGGLIWGARAWSIHHVRVWTGRQDLGFVNCNNCHFQRIDKLPWAKPRPHHPAPAGLAVSPDGTKIYIALDDLNEVVEADTATRSITRRTHVAGAPFSLALSADGERLYVACRHGDRVVALETCGLNEVDSIGVGDAPVAIAFARTPAGDRLVVANSISDDISVLETSPLREIVRPQAGREPFAVTIPPDGSVAFVANRLAVPETFLCVPASELTLLDPVRGRILNRSSLFSAHLSEGAAVVPGRGWALTPLVKVRNLIPITQVANGWVMSSGLAISDHEGNITQVPLDEAHDYFADPSGIVVDPAGQRAYIASSGSDVISVVDLDRLDNWLAQADETARQDAIYDLSLSTEYLVARIPTARNPRQLALSPDGSVLFASERLNDSVLMIDTATLEPLGRIVLGDGGWHDPIRRGESVFTKAAHTFQRQFSCRSCHPDGHVDGLSYDFDGDGIGDNLLDNRSLQGIAGTKPFKWIGTNPSLEVQCGPRFARVLMRTQPIPPDDLKDLTAYLESLPPTRWQQKHNKPLNPSQERGKKIFFATETSDGTPIPRDRQCHTCHRPPLFTNRLLSSVGTKGPRDFTDMFDTPHLLGIAHSAPYLHDGRAKTLEELWTVYQTNDLHGVSSYMDKHQLNDLIEYLKTL